jgi:molybdopterin-guanine dinucleotide biosynthesis protein A
VTEAAGSATLVGNVALGIPDLYPGEGPVGGILTALEHTHSDWNLIVACDLPRAEAPFLRRLLDAAVESGADALLPRSPSGLVEPLCAVYHKRAQASIAHRFAAGTRKVTLALEGLVVVTPDVDEVAPFQNLNTPEDWLDHAGK